MIDLIFFSWSRMSKRWFVIFVLIKKRKNRKSSNLQQASIAQLGERKTEDLEAPCSIHGRSSVTFRDSIVASIPACHAGDRGSIPRRGATFY